MAQVVDYFEDNITYKEGPFVVTRLFGNDYNTRVEVELVGHARPVLPHSSIYRLMSDLRLPPRGKLQNVSRTVNKLNMMVEEEQIKLVNSWWVSS